MKGLATFLQNSRDRLATMQLLVDRNPASPNPSAKQRHATEDQPVLTAGETAPQERGADDDALARVCETVDARNLDDLDAAILYLQNRCAPCGLVTEGAEDENFVPANDPVVIPAAEAVGAPVPAPAPVPVTAEAPAQSRPSDRFGRSETSLFHAGQDWIALDDRRIGKAPAA